MKISSFMDSVKSPELAKRFSDKVPTTVNEMMERLDDFVCSEEAYANTELPKGETGESHRKISLPFNGRDTRPFRSTRPVESRRDEYKNNYRGRDTYRATRARDDRAPYPYPSGEYNRRAAPVLTLHSLTKYPKEILATETQLPKKTARNRTRVGKTKSSGEGCATERKGIPWPRQSTAIKDNQYISEEPLIVEAEVEGYLVRRVLRETHTDLVEFAGEVSKPLGKIELEVCFSNRGLCRKTSMKFIMFSTPKGIATLVTRTVVIAECRRLERKQMIEEESLEKKGEVVVTEEVLVNPSFPDQLVTIKGGLSDAARDQLKCLLKDNLGVFAWEPSDMTGVPRRIIEHALNVNPSLDPVCQKRRTFSTEKSGVVTNEVTEWVHAGYHQIQMAEEDEEKTAFYTDQGTYCYTKMPFGLKNAGATYQRLVDSTFQSQIGRNLEAYVDDMVIKSRDEKMLLADISETFDNLKKINMKLNPKKCSFGVEEGKFLGYMVTSEGIRANLRKTRALADLQSP
ncbi:reverse transcriptase domain-containing protein [Tanacetum coccineum]